MTKDAAVNLTRTAVNAALLVVVDALVFNQGVLAVLVGLWQLLVALPRALLVRRLAHQRDARLRRIALWMAAVVAVLAFNVGSNRLAQSRADALVVAVKAFHAQHQRYPKSLQELVPAFVPEVPRAKYTLVFNHFWYSTQGDDAMLFYVALPPFGRPTYTFSRGEWGYID